MLTKNEERLYEEAKAFGEAILGEQAKLCREGHQTIRGVFDLLSEAGYCGLITPRDKGGKGLTFAEATLVYEGLAYGSGILTFLLQLHNNIAYEIACYYELSKEVEMLLPGIQTGERLLAFALTESSSGSDPKSTQSYAELHDDGYHIHGKKAWIANAGDADYFNVMVKEGKDGEGMLMLLVDRETEGFTIGPSIQRLGGNIVSCCDLVFEDCVVPRSRLLSDQGLKEALKAIDVARMFVPSIAVGICSRAMDLTLEFLAGRESFGQRIINSQGIQWELAELETALTAGRWMVYCTAHQVMAGKKNHGTTAMSKLYMTELVERMTEKCLQLHGSAGYRADAEIGRLNSEGKMLRMIDGTEEIQKIVIGRTLAKGAMELLDKKGYRDEKCH